MNVLEKIGDSFLIVSLMACMATLFACSSSDDNNNEDDEKEEVVHNVVYENNLKGTSWVQTKRVINGKDLELAPRTITFTDEKVFSYPSTFGKYCYKLKSGSKKAGLWYVNGNNELCMYNLESDYDSFEKGANSAYYGIRGSNGCMITTLNSNCLSYYCYSSLNEKEEWTYKKFTMSDNEGGNSTTYEKPEIGLEDYTCYATSITVKYRIYNQDEAEVTSAKGYYGTSSASISTSASVAGSLITIRITGLKKGTTYYVKCSATGKGGTTTSDATKFITNY